VEWVTLRTTTAQWEAELMQQMLAAHQIPSRIVPHGVVSHFGCAVSTLLQVRCQDQWTALLLLSLIDEMTFDESPPDNSS
jgi:predicted alpha/beta hydrolase family esterase